jgi:Bacterial protein of unknown function (DUF899)
MCPAYITTAALIAAGATSTGSVAALVMKKHRAKNGAKNIDPTSQTRGGSKMDSPRVVSRAEWLAVRKQHLKKEKEFTRLRDELSAERRALPWVKVDKNYVFEGPNGHRTLGDLFEGKRQLIVYHFMFGPDWTPRRAVGLSASFPISFTGQPALFTKGLRDCFRSLR